MFPPRRLPRRSSACTTSSVLWTNLSAQTEQRSDQPVNGCTRISPSHHFSDHHDVWSSLLVDGQDIHESHVPEDDIETIHDSPGDKGFSSGQPKPEADEEGCNGQKVTNVGIVTEPHLDLLAYFSSFRHKHLQNKRCRKAGAG